MPVEEGEHREFKLVDFGGGDTGHPCVVCVRKDLIVQVLDGEHQGGGDETMQVHVSERQLRRNGFDLFQVDEGEDEGGRGGV